MKKIATASLLVIMFIAGCSSSSNDSQKGISITATRSTAWEGTGDYIEFVIDLGSPNETASNIIVYFDASGTALDRNDIEGNTDLLNGYVEIPPSQSHHHKAIRIEGFTSDGNITETQTITLRITGCSSAEYPIGPESEATAIVMDSDGPTATDIDGNLYHSVLIGTQTWMVENLKTSRFRNGDTVQGSWIYKDYIHNLNIYGRLYNWYAVHDPRGLAPAGWHIPSNSEWTQLADYLGGENVAGGKMKEIGTAHWKYPNSGATNSSGFTGLPGGYMHQSANFFLIGILGNFWTSSEEDKRTGRSRNLSYDDSHDNRSGNNKTWAFSVRCVKD